MAPDAVPGSRVSTDARPDHMSPMGNQRSRVSVAVVVVTSIVMFGGCGGRSAAQRAYLISESSGLGRCTLGEGGGDFGAGFDPLRADSWVRMNADAQAWARVVRWQISSKPKDPPRDFTVMVKARFDLLRGSRAVLRPTVGAHQQDATSITKALQAGFDVYVGVRRITAAPYVMTALAVDKTGKVAWLGGCAARNSDSTAANLKRANVDPKRVGPALRRWFSDGDTRALLRALTGS